MITLRSFVLNHFCFLVKGIASQTFISKSMFDKSMYSEPFSIINLLSEYEQSENRTEFCNTYSLSQPRMKHLHSAYMNLKARCKTALECDKSMLDFEFVLTAEKLVILRVMQVWFFHETIIKLKTEECVKSLDIIDEVCCVPISGNTENLDDHFESILHQPKSYEVYKVENICNSSYTGFWKPITEHPNIIPNLVTFQLEEKMVSIGIERGFDMIVLNDRLNTVFFISKKKVNDVRDLYDSLGLTFSNYFLFKYNNSTGASKRGRENRDCSKWKVLPAQNHSNMEADDGFQIFLKYSMIKGAVSLKNIRDSIKSLQQKDVNSFCLSLRNGTIASFDAHIYGGQNDSFSKQDVSDLFETSLGNIKISKQSCVNRKVLKFVPDNSACIPQSLRLVTAIASNLRRPKPTLRFEQDEEIIEIVMNIQPLTKRWMQLKNEAGVFVDVNSIPASIIPLDGSCTMYACCANVLELQGGMTRVEGLTILPKGHDFISLAFKCANLPLAILKDKHCSSVNDEYKLDLADRFYHEFWSDLGMNLDYSLEAVTLLLELFDIYTPNSSPFVD